MNLHDDAVEFVRINNCVQSTPVELIEKAMNYGALKMAIKTAGELGSVLTNLRKKHKDSQPHQETIMPIPVVF
jgi:hypothetical protein